MPQVTLTNVSEIILRDSHLFIPRCIERAIEETVENDADTVNQAGEELMDEYGPLYAPIKFDYDSSAIVDGYSVFYTRRNVIIPRIALRDIVLNSKLNKFPSQIRILDLGSGTGAVVLGLLEMFQHAPLNSISVDVDAVDIAPQALIRLTQLLKAAKLTPKSITTICQDVTDVNKLNRKLLDRGNYKLIFAANLFGELTDKEATDVLECIAPKLTSKGLIFIVNAPKDPFIEMMPKLIEKANQMNLTVYYPCPPNRPQSSCSKCWFWREYEYDRGDIKVEGRLMSGSYREQLTTSWLIFSRKPVTIYDDFIAQHPKLNWGPFSVFGQDSATCDSQVCTSSGTINRLRIGKSIKRGSLVGGLGKNFRITQYCEL